jgi:hypothetical protein
MALRNNLAVHFYNYFTVYLATALIVIFLMVAGSPAASSACLPGRDMSVGFGKGLAHGFLFLVDIIRSLFDPKIGIYQMPNAGEKYNLGFFSGIVLWYWLAFLGKEMGWKK